MKLIEFWRWRYRDVATGQVCRTPHQLSIEEARARFPDAEPIAGSMRMRPVADDFADTEAGFRDAASPVPAGAANGRRADAVR